jgi:hypothetical protein
MEKPGLVIPAFVSSCEGFQTPAVTEHSPTEAAGV